MSFLTSATDVAIEKDLKQFLIILVIALGAAILFLVLGDQINLAKLVQNIETTALAIAAIVISQALTIYGFSALSNWLARANRIVVDQHQLTISSALHQTQLDFAKQQLQQLHTDIAHMQEQHPKLQAFSLQQHQENLLSIESEIYTKFVQAGLLKNSLPPIMQKIFEH